MMEPQWRKCFAEWATTRDYRLRVRSARERVHDALMAAERPYSTWSGGKDSTVMTHLVLRAKPNLMVMHWDYGRAFIPESIHREILHNASAIGVKSLRVETSSEYVRLGRNARNVLGSQMFGRLIPKLRENGYDLAFVGLRSEESLKRRRRIRAQRSLTKIQECWPVQDWRWQDVWAYIVEHDLPYLSLYDRMSQLVGYERSRFTTLFDPEFAHLGADTTHNVLFWRWRNVAD